MIEEIVMMEWPRVRTVNWEYGILTLDNTKNIEVSMVEGYQQIT